MGGLKHLAIIPDGNRRWAKKHSLPPWEGHRRGLEKLKEVINWWLKTDIKELSIYTLSYENFKNRSKIELKYLFKLIESQISTKNGYIASLIEKGVRIRFVGLIHLLPKRIYEKLKEIMRKSKNNKGKILNFLIVYGGRLEIARAISLLIKKNISKITVNTIKRCLWVPSDVDLIIRTGGYSRLSNLLLYQSAYAEIYVINKLWPEIALEDIEKAVNWFYNVQRNFGR